MSLTISTVLLRVLKMGTPERSDLDYAHGPNDLR
jgi:hypothetical protein